MLGSNAQCFLALFCFERKWLTEPLAELPAAPGSVDERKDGGKGNTRKAKLLRDAGI